LPKAIVNQTIDLLKKSGVTIKENVIVGKLITIVELKKKYDAIFIGSGAGLPKLPNIRGINLNHVYSANEYLTRVNLMRAHMFPKHKTPVKKSKLTIVVGGGNVAIDAARVARRLGSEVTILYRRSYSEMKARELEIKHAKEEGIQFMLLTNPTKVLGKTQVEGVECVQMMLGYADEDGRRIPVRIEGSEFTMRCDQVIYAIGQAPNKLLIQKLSVDKDESGHLIVKENLQTSDEMIFAGGDIVRGDCTAIRAIAEGKKAAFAINQYLKNNKD
jgi:glutamate synthase (NADPH/NADH) small chain